VSERIGRKYGQRVSRLTQRDLPALADALVGVMRGQGLVGVYNGGDTRYVRISGNGMSVLVRDEDWSKILPYLAEGALDSTLNPATPEVTGQPVVHYDTEWVRLKDSRLQWKVLSLLKRLFLTTYPTSKI